MYTVQVFLIVGSHMDNYKIMCKSMCITEVLWMDWLCGESCPLPIDMVLTWRVEVETPHFQRPNTNTYKLNDVNIAFLNAPLQIIV